jgi:probable rRNA maturation factor
MSKPNKIIPELSLSVDYAVKDERLPRWRIRRWVMRALQTAHADGLISFDRMQLGIKIVGLTEGRKLNAAYRQKDYATNVLTFEYGVMPDGTACGDIVLCLPVLIKEAREQSKSVLDHAAHLTMHGTLHALGYDHIKSREAKHMEALETAMLAELGITDPYVLP